MSEGKVWMDTPDDANYDALNNWTPVSTTETGLDLRAARGRYEAWYADREADTPGLDEGESLSEYIVRNDLPELLSEVERRRGQVARVETLAEDLRRKADEHDARSEVDTEYDYEDAAADCRYVANLIDAALAEPVAPPAGEPNHG